MNKEELLNELIDNNGEFEKQIFKDVILDNIECERLAFYKCTFENVQFVDNKVEWVEFNECQFNNTVFSGKLQNTLLDLSNNVFKGCKVCDFEVFGFDEQSEITDNIFENCYFSNINIEADVSILGEE